MTTRRKKVSEERVGVIKTDYPKPGIYAVSYACGNCGWSGTINFTRGKVAPAVATCPRCECYNAKKSLPYRRTEPVPMDPIIPTPFPADVPPWPRELPKPDPLPTPWKDPYRDPWDVPYKPYRPWEVPPRPHLDPWRVPITSPEIGRDNDNNQRYRRRDDQIVINEYDEGLGYGGRL